MTRVSRIMAVVLAVALAAPARADDFSVALAEAAAGRHGAAAAVFRRLAEEGDAEAAHNLAILFQTGRGVPQNLTEAAFWAWQARLSGIAASQSLIARIMPELPDDRRAAVAARLEANWRPLAQGGDGAAMLSLAAILLHARPEPDASEAHAWQSMAAALDVPGALAARDATLAMIPREDRLTVQDAALARFVDWCATHEKHPPAACLATGG